MESQRMRWSTVSLLAASALVAVLSPGWRDELRAQVGYGPPDRYKCYEASSKTKFTPVDVVLHDEIESRTSTIQRLVFFCSPVDVNGEGVTDGDLSYGCYGIGDAAAAGKQPKFGGAQLMFANELGETTAALSPARMLCVPGSVVE